jgi:hypothetical protein
MQRAGPTSVLSGGGRDNTVLAAILSLPIGVGRCETQRIGYTCRRDVLTIFGQGFNSPRLHQTDLSTRSHLLWFRATGKPPSRLSLLLWMPAPHKVAAMLLSVRNKTHSASPLSNQPIALPIAPKTPAFRVAFLGAHGSGLGFNPSATTLPHCLIVVSGCLAPVSGSCSHLDHATGRPVSRRETDFEAGRRGLAGRGRIREPWSKAD